MGTIYLEKRQVPGWLLGGYSGDRFSAQVCETVTIPADAGLWEGGSRASYRVVRLRDGAAVRATDELAAPWDRRRAEEVRLEPGFAVVCHSMFCGKDMGLRFYVHPADAVGLLPSPVELSELECLVLRATQSYKASYGGRDRYQMACAHLHGAVVPTRAQWDEAKAGLIVRGYLTKAGAITVAGRNAVA